MGEHYIRGNKEMHFVYKKRLRAAYVKKKEATLINDHLFK